MLGSESLPWKTVYTQYGTVSKSDESLKNIEEISKDQIAFFDTLVPVQYTWKNNLKQIHFGFGAQTVEKGLKNSGLNSEDYYLLQKGETYNLAYSEFIALNTHQIQQLKKRVAELAKRLGESS